MKKLFQSFAVLALLSMASCTDWVDPAIPYAEFETGVFLRTLQFPATSFVFTDLASSNVAIQVEAVDEENGGLVDEVDVFVALRRGQTVFPEAKMMTVPASAFQPHSVILPNIHPASGSPYLAAAIEFTALDALQEMGRTLNDVEGGDFFEVRLSLRDTKGRTFSSDNLSGDVQGGGYYRSPFFYRIPIVCVSNLAGTYDLSTVGWCGDTYTGQVRFVQDTDEPTNYIVQVDLDGEFEDDFSFGSYRSCYGAGTQAPGGANGLRLTDACNQIGFNPAGSSPWGDNFSVESVSVDGAVLTMEVRSNWDTGGGVFEGGVATITRTDGTNWPDLK